MNETFVVYTGPILKAFDGRDEVVEHFFADGDIAEGNFIYSNGLEFNGGSDSDDATYVALDTLITI